MDDVFVDALNLSGLDTVQLEGKRSKPISKYGFYFMFFILFVVILGFTYRLYELQIVKGEYYAKISRENSLERKVIFSKRGVIKDRYGRLLAYNSSEKENLKVDGMEMNLYLRRYTEKYKGLSHILGYIKYPAKDKYGKLWRDKYEGVSGIEKYLNDRLNGTNSVMLIEKNASGKQVSSAKLLSGKDGENITLSIDAKLNDMLYKNLVKYLQTVSFKAGAAAIMDIKSGEILAMTSYPDYDLNKFANKDTDYINRTLKDKNKPLLDRAALGQYAPGSIVKPFVALAALNEHIISPNKKLLSKGALLLPNPYNPDKPTVFKDWRAHGWINMKEAIAHSSDEYFYIIGGGYKDQEGLGIKRLMKYARLFGLGEKTGVELASEATGLVPSPKWKKEHFGEEWNVGNTYHTAIGQYGFLMTVAQALRYASALALGDSLPGPTLLLDNKRPVLRLPFKQKDVNVIHDGMRMATNIGTARPLKIPGIQIAAKTGTAQTGIRNESKNSWVIGFWPYKNPRFAFAAMLEKGDEHDHGSASHAMREFFFELLKELPSYAEGKYPNVESADTEKKISNEVRKDDKGAAEGVKKKTNNSEPSVTNTDD